MAVNWSGRRFRTKRCPCDPTSQKQEYPQTEKSCLKPQQRKQEKRKKGKPQREVDRDPLFEFRAAGFRPTVHSPFADAALKKPCSPRAARPIVVSNPPRKS